jgi:esterase/lipase superfamily enzyme
MPVVDLFFVTNRQALAGRAREFGDETGDALAYGVAQVRMPANLRVGDIQEPEIPRRRLDNRRAVVEEVTLLSPPEFQTRLAARLGNSRTFDLWIHGINHSFDSALRQAATLSFNLDMPQPAVVFAWPTAPGILPKIYADDKSKVTAAAKQLAAFLDAMKEKLDPRSMNIIAHSLGCKVVCEAFDILIKEPAWNDPETEVANIVLAAPDVARKDFDETFVKDMAKVAQRVTVYVARNDGVLALSSYLNGRHRAGEFDEDEFKLKDLVVPDASQAPHIQIVDATFVNSYLTVHSGFYQSRATFNDVQNLLRHGFSAQDRHLLRHEQAGLSNYWILRP